MFLPISSTTNQLFRSYKAMLPLNPTFYFPPHPPTKTPLHPKILCDNYRLLILMAKESFLPSLINRSIISFLVFGVVTVLLVLIFSYPFWVWDPINLDN